MLRLHSSPGPFGATLPPGEGMRFGQPKNPAAMQRGSFLAEIEEVSVGAPVDLPGDFTGIIQDNDRIRLIFPDIAFQAAGKIPQVHGFQIFQAQSQEGLDH